MASVGLRTRRLRAGLSALGIAIGVAAIVAVLVAGILRPATLTPGIDSSVLVGFPAAEKCLGFDGHPSSIYVRTQQNQVAAVDSVLGNAANPENPTQVNVSQPSAALVAREEAQSALNGLFLGLGAVSLLGGAVGVAVGVLATTIYAHIKGWGVVVPTVAWAGGLAAALAIGAIAGLLPAMRAARMEPTEALRTA